MSAVPTAPVLPAAAPVATPPVQPVAPAAPVAAAPQQPIIPTSLTQPFQVTAPPPQQQQQAPSQPQTYTNESLYQAIATSLGTSPEVIRERVGANPMEAIGTLVRDAIGVVQSRRQAEPQATPVAASQPAQPALTPGPDGKIPLPPGVEQVVRKNEQGLWEPITPAYKQYADIQNHNDLVDRQRFEKYQQNPLSMLEDPSFKGAIQQQMKALVDEQMRNVQLDSITKEYQSKYYPEIMVYGNDKQPVYGLDGKPSLTPLGVAFAKHMQELTPQGVALSPDQLRSIYENSMKLARFDVAQSQPQQTPPLPAQFQQGQPPANPVAQFIQQAQQNAQTYYPGQPPARPAPQPTSLQGSLWSVANQFPADMSVGQMLDQIGPLFTVGSGRR